MSDRSDALADLITLKNVIMTLTPRALPPSLPLLRTGQARRIDFVDDAALLPHQALGPSGLMNGLQTQLGTSIGQTEINVYRL